MRNAVMAVMLVAAGVSSSYVNRTGGSDGAGEAVATGKTPSLEGSLPQPIDDPRDLIDDFLDPQNSPKSHPVPDCSVPKQSKQVQNLSFLIAAVPDPERTHLGLYFDRFLEAIILAAEEENFSYDRYWLPWHVSHEPPNHHLADQDVLDGRGEERHRQPGVIIFRDNFFLAARTAGQPVPDASRSINNALVVFLVGETPTAGIDRHQFQRAVDYIHSFNGCNEKLRVLGPTFSGSVTSLKKALRDFPERDVISGAASNSTGLEGLAGTTVHSDYFISEALQTFLHNQIRITGGITLLREGGTGFAKGLGIGPMGQANIIYPRELSRLRNVYPEQINSAAAQVANLQQQLSLRLRDSRLGEETVPQFSDHTPLTQESVLLQISETLRRDHIGLAVITGTDVLDVLFLSRHLRELSPDVRLLLWDSDLLFVHGTDTLDFSGMLALSTYPLMPANQHWTGTSLDYYDFPSNMTEGVYNACRLLINPGDKALREYSAPASACSSRPPVWLTVVGRDAYWPLGFLEDDSTLYDPDRGMKDGDFARQNGLDTGWPTRAWSAVFYSCSLLAFFYAMTSLRVRISGDLPRWCSFLHPRPYDAPPFWRADYSFVLALSLLLAYSTFLFPVLRLGFQNQRFAWRLMLLVGIIALMLLIRAATPGLRRIASWIAALVGIAACVAMILMLYPFTSENFFRALRSVQLDSGVGPNLPLFFLFLAFAWWASIEMQRARLVAEHRPEIPDIAGNQAATNISRINCWLAQGLLHVDPSGWIVVAAGIVVTSMAAFPHIRSVEGRLFDLMVCALVIPLATLIFLRTYSFMRLWSALYRMLEALELRPIRFAFSNLPNDVSWSPLWQYGARRKSYTLLLRSLESLRSLRECSPNYYPGLSREIGALEYYVAEILSPVNQGIEEPISITEDSQALLAQITGNLSKALQDNKWGENCSETVAKMEKACESSTLRKGSANWFSFGQAVNFEFKTAPSDLEPCEKPDTLAAEVVALRYLAYIRYVMRHLRNILSFITTGFILMTLALNCYPFQTLNLIRWSITSVFVLISVVLLNAFQEMSRNEILSRITDTKAGSLDAGFYTRVVSIGALPVLAVVASHFPSVGRFLFSWVQPAISALH